MNGILEIIEKNNKVRELSFSDFNIDYRLNVINIKSSFGEKMIPFKKINKEYFLNNSLKLFKIKIYI